MSTQREKFLANQAVRLHAHEHKHSMLTISQFFFRERERLKVIFHYYLANQEMGVLIQSNRN